MHVIKMIERECLLNYRKGVFVDGNILMVVIVLDVVFCIKLINIC